MAKRHHDRSATKALILEAARTIARERGYNRTTLAMIQKQAGVHPGSLYWFFEDKDSLFAALVDHAYAESMSAAAEGPPSPPEGNPVRAALRRIVDNPARYGLWRFNVQLMLDPDMHDSKTAEAIRRLRSLTQESMVAEWLAELDPAVARAHPDLAERLAEYSLATVEGCILARVAGRPLDEDYVTSLAESVLDAQVVDAYRAVGLDPPSRLRERAARAR